jgi:hypothetical protein
MPASYEREGALLVGRPLAVDIRRQAPTRYVDPLVGVPVQV